MCQKDLVNLLSYILRSLPLYCHNTLPLLDVNRVPAHLVENCCTGFISQHQEIGTHSSVQHWCTRLVGSWFMTHTVQWMFHRTVPPPDCTPFNVSRSKTYVFWFCLLDWVQSLRSATCRSAEVINLGHSLISHFWIMSYKYSIGFKSGLNAG